ncbi:UDP-glycosyltransferase 73C12-like [Ricinus communis]|uniref:Glycosyltransferase n=1 Tax=Ricinus communis TaxID=3988 RepID=B9S0A0_RICCO|nr:UDP-glycosyltransferase 73C12-like [Ricinus communis]XP_048226121.1 UDP-glycosyltransferase 73C12-like [Ricinus communis]XP_048226122.1 UDP-glycosyltransferase 73C12-like [Ricinus communis]XP_048226123.1 UDP-glycosyltransferase 73C12-like [Ricinus communis]EEF42833.1 UDP-glucosyltransferase, putative [Ricinus communis]
MASQNQQLQFVFLPHLAQGHMIPMVDMARLLAQHGVTVTIITTPFNAARYETMINRASESGVRIQLLQVPFPSKEVGLPQGCESMDTLPSRDLFKNLLIGITMLQVPVEQLFSKLQPPPSCIISDKNVAWSHQTALKFKIPRLVFDGTSCFSLLCTHNILATKIHESVSDSEPFVVPGLPHQIVLTKGQLPNAVLMNDSGDIRHEIRESEKAAYGVVVNTFEELEPAYISEFQKARGCKVWCVGPVSLCNKETLDKAERGNKASIDENQCLKWLDLRAQGSVLYACLGSLSRLTGAQLIELGLGLEASNRPFIWVIRGGNGTEEFEKWISEKDYETRLRGRGILIRGWAPQVLILSHPAIGGFLTHCGWNSTLEGLCAGIPMITWPLFAEQFYNERFIVQILKIGVRLGSEFSVKLSEEKKSWEEVKRAIDQLMDEAEEGEERRKRAEELGKMARKAIEEGGSSHLNMISLIEDIKKQVISNS